MKVGNIHFTAQMKIFVKTFKHNEKLAKTMIFRRKMLLTKFCVKTLVQNKKICENGNFSQK
jgi:hypothetical protein